MTTDRKHCTGEALWNIRDVHADWARPFHHLAFQDSEQRILPGQYQCDDLKKISNMVLVQDDFLPETLWHDLIQATGIFWEARTGWSIRLKRQTDGFCCSEYRKRSQRLSQTQIDAIEDSMCATANHMWQQFADLLLTEPDAITHIHTWINNGPLADGQAGRYHFTHYDCDEYLEFSKGLYRFPPYAAVFYLNIPTESEGGVIWFPEIKQGVIPKNNRLAIFDARLAHTVLPVIASARKPRVVMVLNLWDYATRDEQFELSNGVCGYTDDRRSELVWHS